MKSGISRSAVAQPIAALALTMCLFVFWGVGQRLFDGLYPYFNTIFHLDGLRAAIIPAVSTAICVCGAIPAAMSARVFGYKGAILLGLGVFGIGLFLIYSASQDLSFHTFIWAIIVMVSGWVLLEMAVNPMVVSLGSRDTAVQRLNFAQALYALGAMFGLLVTEWILRANIGITATSLTSIMVHPVVAVGAAALLLAFLIEYVRFPSMTTDQTGRMRDAGREIRAVLRMPLIRFCIIAQIFNVFAQVQLWNQGPAIVASFLSNPSLETYLDGLVLLFGIFAVGRFVGITLMYRFRAERLLAIFSGCAIALTIVAYCAGGTVGRVSTLAATFFLAINWPTVIALGIRDLGPLMKYGAAPIYMGGSLGGFVMMTLSIHVYPLFPPLGILTTVGSIAVVLWFAIWCERHSRPIAAQTPESLPVPG
jgi:MFS transporter, FHS family, L-fucose permease